MTLPEIIGQIHTQSAPVMRVLVETPVPTLPQWDSLPFGPAAVVQRAELVIALNRVDYFGDGLLLSQKSLEYLCGNVNAPNTFATAIDI